MVDEADELYGLPDDEFTSARDALAKRLRGEKRREEADEVKALRRPSVAAGAINRAVREHGADELLDAGEALREAHEALLSGSGDAAGVREATAREREAVRDFAALALGDGASASTEEKVRATLHAASIDDDVRELLVAGRLERDAEAGADPMALLASKARSGGSGGGSRGRSRSSEADRRQVKERGSGGGSGRAKAGGSGGGSARAKTGGSGDGSARAKAGGSRGRSGPSEAERRRMKAAERAREAANRALSAQAEAEEAAERARSTLAEAEEAARKARAVVEDLEGHERAARRAVKEAEAEAERRRTEARRAVKTAESRT
jgi:hypothetical protein